MLACSHAVPSDSAVLGAWCVALINIATLCQPVMPLEFCLHDLLHYKPRKTVL